MIPFTFNFPIEIPYGRVGVMCFNMTVRRKVAEGWNELSVKQLKRVVRLINSEIKDEYELKVRLVKVLFQFNWRQMLLLRGESRIVDLYPYLDFILQGNDLTINKFMKIKLAWFLKTLYGPEGDFRTLKAHEWTDADTAFMNFMQDRDMRHLDQLVSILWRPKNKLKSKKSEDWDGDLRVNYNPVVSTLRASLMRFVSPSVKLSILQWYMASRNDLEEMFKRVFTGGSKENVESFGWSETIQKVSGSTFGTVNETRGTLMWEVLLHMETQLKDHEYFESKNKG